MSQGTRVSAEEKLRTRQTLFAEGLVHVFASRVRYVDNHRVEMDGASAQYSAEGVWMVRIPNPVDPDRFVDYVDDNSSATPAQMASVLVRRSAQMAAGFDMDELEIPAVPIPQPK